MWEVTEKFALIVRMVSRLSRKFTSEKVPDNDDFGDAVLGLFE